MTNRVYDPLRGLVVLDLTRYLPGPYATTILADLGATVIRVGLPGVPYSVHELYGGDTDSAKVQAFDALARGKIQFPLNLKSEAGLEVIRRLISKTDVLIESFRPGGMEGFGLGDDALRQLNGSLIRCSVSAFGQTGPYAGLAAHDVNIVAMSGMFSLLGDETGRPVHPGIQVADLASGLYAVIGVLAGLLGRARRPDHQGYFVDVAMLEATTSLLAHHASLFLMNGTKLVSSPGARPLDLVRTSDNKFLSVVLAEPLYFMKLCKLIDREDLSTLWPSDDAHVRSTIMNELQGVFATKSREEWWQILRQVNCLVTPVLDIVDTLNDEHLVERGFISRHAQRDSDAFQLALGIELHSDAGDWVPQNSLKPTSSQADVISWAGLDQELPRLLLQGAFN